MFIRPYFTGTKHHFSSQELSLEGNTVFFSLKKTLQKWVREQQKKTHGKLQLQMVKDSQAYGQVARGSDPE